MNTEFAIGDTVRLKSGGALMCIRAFRCEQDEYAECVWHEGKKPHMKIYPVAALVSGSVMPS